MSLLTLPHTLTGWVTLLLSSGTVIFLIALILMIRAIVRPVAARTYKNYGTPQEKGLPAEKLVLSDGCRGWYVSSPQDEHDFALLLVHGRSRSTGWMYPLAIKLWPKSSIMAIDLPGHGESPYALVSYGKHESETVSHAVDWLSERQEKPIVIVGISMGGSSAILAQSHTPSPRVRGIITIGAFTDIQSVFQQVAQQSGIPWWIAQWIFKLSGWIAGFNFKNNRPIDAVTKLQVPLLAIQGKYDHLVPVESAKKFAAQQSHATIECAYYNGPHDAPENPALTPLIQTFLHDRQKELCQDEPKTA